MHIHTSSSSGHSSVIHHQNDHHNHRHNNHHLHFHYLLCLPITIRISIIILAYWPWISYPSNILISLFLFIHFQYSISCFIYVFPPHSGYERRFSELERIYDLPYVMRLFEPKSVAHCSSDGLPVRFLSETNLSQDNYSIRRFSNYKLILLLFALAHTLNQLTPIYHCKQILKSDHLPEK
jgi:hypothetical protein